MITFCDFKLPEVTNCFREVCLADIWDVIT